MLLCAPPPEAEAMPSDEVEAAIVRALARATNVRGARVTPFLLAALEEETGGRSLRTNIALLKNNTRVATEVAVALAAGG